MEVSPCPLDVQYAPQIAALIAPPSPESVKVYFEDVLRDRQNSKIKVDYGKYGKGVFADVGFRKEELILKDKMLVAYQHSSNKVDCLVCSHCFQFIGSLELQIGRKLLLQSLGLSVKHECDDFDDDSMDAETSRDTRSSIPQEAISSLMNGNLKLPYSEKFSLPEAVSCRGDCGEEHYCSVSCAEADWDSCHSLLCTGSKPNRSRREALVNFIEHANSTNDIFLLSAKVISSTILRYKKLKDEYLRKTEEIPLNGKGMSWFPLLLEAWSPVSMGYKKRWWECIALPDDVDPINEVSFRSDLRDVAHESLKLLRSAIFDPECAPLFSLDVYGHIIGMFELNNLDLVVASPVEDYFLFVDDLPASLKAEAEKCTGPFLDALGDSYSICCQGSAFYPVQSCMNHSCCPNAKAFKRDEDKDGQAIIIALRPILKGEEITISYIDDDLDYEERKAMLADYGFECQCRRCMEEGDLVK